jgi:hypothetical protein
MHAGLKQTENKITKKLDDMVKRGRSGRYFITKEVYPRYQEYQVMRWKTENWGKWPKLNPEYAKKKLVKHAGDPGQGRVMMIATSRLYGSVVGRVSNGTPPTRGLEHHFRVITDTSLIVGISETEGEMQYAKRANASRPFFGFKPDFKKTLKDRYARYMRGT